MKINPVVFVVIATAFFAIKSFAATETIEFKGVGVDGNACSATIVRDGKALKSIQLDGAVKEFEIISECGVQFGSVISSNGAKDLLGSANQTSSLKNMDHSYSLLKKAETFSSTKDLGDGGKKMTAVQLKYDRKGNLISVTAGTKVKALWVATIASSQFTCELLRH